MPCSLGAAEKCHILVMMTHNILSRSIASEPSAYNLHKRMDAMQPSQLEILRA